MTFIRILIIVFLTALSSIHTIPVVVRYKVQHIEVAAFRARRSENFSLEFQWYDSIREVADIVMGTVELQSVGISLGLYKVTTLPGLPGLTFYGYLAEVRASGYEPYFIMRPAKTPDATYLALYTYGGLETQVYNIIDFQQSFQPSDDGTMELLS